MRFLFLLMATVLSTTPREWRDSIRDVYINGKLDRSAQSLVSVGPPPPAAQTPAGAPAPHSGGATQRMYAVVCGDEVLFYEPDAKIVSRAPKSAFTFSADRMTATTTPEFSGEQAGSLVKADGSYLATLDGKTVLIAPHESKAGPMTIDELWATAPVWRAIADNYEPDAAIVERLKNINEPVRLQIVMATWCGDSRQHVPRLLKSIARAANPNIYVELYGIGPEFTSPMELVQGENITNVPTVIVRSDANEIGRFVETPAGKTIEEDIADIVQGTPQAHPSRHERGALRTRGTYRLRDARRRFAGTEQFEVYEKIVHSVIRKRDGTTVETWASPAFVEVTQRGATTTRARFRKNGDTWSAESRGADGGIIDQVLVTPDVVVTPATITYTWARNAARAFVIPENGMGAVRDVKLRMAEGEVPKFVRLEDGSTRRLSGVR